MGLLLLPGAMRASVVASVADGRLAVRGHGRRIVSSSQALYARGPRHSYTCAAEAHYAARVRHGVATACAAARRVRARVVIAQLYAVRCRQGTTD